MSRFGLGVILALGLCQLGFAYSGERCGGGDGPHPMSDISNILKFNIRALDIAPSVQEYLAWENRKYLVYRDASGDIKGLNISLPMNANPKEIIVGKSMQTLTNLVDADERYLVTKGDKIGVFDFYSKVWTSPLAKTKAEPLFWHQEKSRKYLVSHLTAVSGTGAESHLFYASQPGETVSEPTCTFTQSKEYPLKVARGASAPYYYFYSVSEVGDRRMLTIHPLNVMSCRFEKNIIYEGIRHPVKDVIRFDAFNAIAVKLDDPKGKQNLLWWSPQGCNYFDIGTAEPMVPNYRLPILVTWTPESSIQLFYPDRAEKVELLKGLPIASLNESDIWLAKDGNRLFLGTQLQEEKQRWILEMDVAMGRQRPSHLSQR